MSIAEAFTTRITAGPFPFFPPLKSLIMETGNGQKIAVKASSFTARLVGLSLMLMFVATSCTKGDECGDPENPCIVTEEIIDY